MYYEYVMLFPLFFANMKYSKKDPLDVPSDLRVALFIRVITGCSMDVLLALAFQYTSFSKATCICFMNTLFIPVFSYIFNREKMIKWDFFGIIIGFIGMIMVIQPYKAVENEVYDFWTDILGCFIAFIAALTSAACVAFIQRLAKANIHYTVNGIYYNFGIVLLGPFISYLIPRKNFPEYSWTFVGLTIASALFAYAQINMFANVAKMLSGGTIGVIVYLSIPISLLQDVLFFNKIVEAIELSGMAIILVVNVVLGLLKIKGVLK